MGQIYVKASRRAKAHTRASRKGPRGARVLRLKNKIKHKLGKAFADTRLATTPRLKSLLKRYRRIR